MAQGKGRESHHQNSSSQCVVCFEDSQPLKVCGLVCGGQAPVWAEILPMWVGFIICDQMRNKWCVVYMAFDCSNNPSFNAGEPIPFLLLS